jgi:hypothetical protein
MIQAVLAVSAKKSRSADGVEWNIAITIDGN